MHFDEKCSVVISGIHFAFRGVNKSITHLKQIIMLKWTAIFFMIAVIAAIFGFTGIAAGAASVAKTLFFIFLILVVITAILGVTIFKKS